MLKIHLIRICVTFLIGVITAVFAKRSKKNPYIWFFSGLIFGVAGLITLFFLNIYEAKKAKKTKKILKRPYVIEDSKFWYYLDDHKKRFGPISLNKLKNLWEENKIFSNTYVWNDNLTEWKILKELKEYSSFKKTTN